MPSVLCSKRPVLRIRKYRTGTHQVAEGRRVGGGGLPTGGWGGGGAGGGGGGGVGGGGGGGGRGWGGGIGLRGRGGGGVAFLGWGGGGGGGVGCANRRGGGGLPFVGGGFGVWAGGGAFFPIFFSAVSFCSSLPPLPCLRTAALLNLHAAFVVLISGGDHWATEARGHFEGRRLSGVRGVVCIPSRSRDGPARVLRCTNFCPLFPSWQHLLPCFLSALLSLISIK